jgi:hypothetical protein
MKKIFTIVALAALTISCNNLLEPADVALGDGNTLDLSAWCVSSQTRADSEDNDNEYNENALVSIDYFIYTKNSTYSSAAVAHDRWTLSTTEKASKVVSMGAYQAQYGVEGHVFMVANLPEGTVTGNESVTALRALPVPETNFKQTGSDNKFKAQDSFVMISEDWVDFTLSQTETVSVSVPLSRRAAKISIEINIAKWYNEIHYTDKTQEGTYKQTWYPNIRDIQVYMQNFTNEGTLDGTPIPVSQVGSFVGRYERDAFISTAEDMGRTVAFTTDVTVPATTVTGTPFYSYPSCWESKDVNAPFLKVILKWSSYDEGGPISNVPATHGTQKVIDKEFYYKITIPNQLELKSNNWYKINLDLAVLGSEADDATVTIPGTYSIVAWSDPDEAMGGDLNSGRYLTVGGNKTQEKVGNIVYETFVAYSDKVEIPIITSHPFEVVGTPSSDYDTFKSPYTVGHLTYGTSADGTSFKITPSDDYTYLTLEHNRVKSINSTSFEAKDVAPITYTFQIKHTDNSNYNRYIKVIQYPSIYVSQIDGGNVFLDGYFQCLTSIPDSFGYAGTVNKTDNGYTISGYQSRGFNGTVWNYNSTVNSNAYRTGDNSQHNTTPGNGNHNYVMTPYGPLTYDGKLPRKMTLVTVSAFDSSSSTYTISSAGSSSNKFEYLIADPRSSQNWTTNAHLIPYLTSQSTANSNNMTHTAWTEAQEKAIKVGTRTKNFIAPAFLISSRWNRPGEQGTYPQTLEQAEQRCATYQEAGFPAGRWRLPTEAEIFFVYTLQNKNLVDGLFTGGTSSYGYWASSGNDFGYRQATGSESFVSHNNTTNRSIRCVYDYWYWGDERVDDNKFTPKP